MVRRRRAGRFGGDLGIIPLQPGFSPETPIIRISGKVGLLSATQSCTFWWQKLFLRIPPCTFFRKKYQKLSDGCLACFRRPNAGNGRLTALQPGFSPETPIIRISGKVGLLSATQSCTFWWQKLFLRIPPCTFFRKKYQKLSDGCLACFRRPNAGNGRLTAGLQANLPRFSRF